MAGSAVKVLRTLVYLLLVKVLRTLVYLLLVKVLRTLVCLLLVKVLRTLVYLLLVKVLRTLVYLLCLGGRSHEAYSSSFVCLFVIPSVSSVLRRTLNDEP